MGLKSCFGLH